MTTTAETTKTVQMYRVYIKATPQAIWNAITKPEWTEKYGYAPLVEYELRPGGKFRVHAGTRVPLPVRLVADRSTSSPAAYPPPLTGDLPETYQVRSFGQARRIAGPATPYPSRKWSCVNSALLGHFERAACIFHLGHIDKIKLSLAARAPRCLSASTMVSRRPTSS